MQVREGVKENGYDFLSANTSIVLVAMTTGVTAGLSYYKEKE